MKKTLLILVLCLCAAMILSCTPPDNNNTGNTGAPDNNNTGNVDAPGTDNPGSENGGGDKNDPLVEDEDYIDLASKYDGEGFDYNSSLWYMNELSKVPLPDPHIYVENDTYYIVGTNERNVNTVDCYVTKDFLTFELYPDIYDPYVHAGWEGGSAEIYAPEIYCFDGVYYLYYSANDKTNTRRCSVVSADNPLGPYEPIVNDKVDGLNTPIFYDPDYPNRALDATVFTDDDGRMYMYFTVTDDTQHIVGVELISPYEADWSSYRDLVIPGTVDSESEEQILEWEMYRDNKVKIAEAPFMIKSEGKYYLTYSVNGCWNKYYNVCYAVSDTPLGNFVKPYREGELWTNILMGFPGTPDEEELIYSQWEGFASGTGHHSFFYVGDQLMIGYHAHQNRGWNSKYYTPRYFAIDYVHFDKKGTPFCNGPSYAVINLPGRISGFDNICENSTVKGSNVQNVNGAVDNYIVDLYNLDTKDNEVKLGKGESVIEITFDRSYEIGGVLVYNSAYYENFISEIKYIDFGDGNIVYYPQFCADFYVNDETEFINPLSTINIEFLKTFNSSSVKICFDLPDGGSINEIVVLGK